MKTTTRKPRKVTSPFLSTTDTDSGGRMIFVRAIWSGSDYSGSHRFDLAADLARDAGRILKDDGCPTRCPKLFTRAGCGVFVAFDPIRGEDQDRSVIRLGLGESAEAWKVRIASALETLPIYVSAPGTY
jgi:hypothetical protein